MNLESIFGVITRRRITQVTMVAVSTLVASAAFAQSPAAPGPANKDQDRLRQMLRERAAALHSEMIKTGDKIQFVDVDGNPTEEVAAEPAVAQAGENAAAAPKPEQPLGQGARLVFDAPQHDFGVQQDGIALICKFSFKNRGTERLIINAINTGCGCTAAKLPKQEYDPGEGGEIEITYNPKGSGKQQRSIQVNSNDAQQPNMQLVISAQVIPLIEARPNSLQFGTVSIGETRSLQLVVVSRDKNFKITSVESNGPEVIAEHSPDAKAEVLVEPELPGVQVVTVTIKNDAPVGRVLRTIAIKGLASKEEGKPQEAVNLTVNAFAVVKGEINVTPTLIRVPPLAANAQFEREVIVTRSGNKPFNLIKAEIVNSTLNGIEVITEPYQEGEVKGYRVKIKGQAGPTAGNFRGSLMIHTDLEREKTTEVQFSGIVRVPPPAGGAASGPGPQGAAPQDAIPLTAGQSKTASGSTSTTIPAKQN